ncbi:hypothetical protein ABH935_008914 [Catenulispora sp. GAS73]
MYNSMYKRCAPLKVSVGRTSYNRAPVEPHTQLRNGLRLSSRSSSPPRSSYP